jgi:hypothetical protein
MRCAGAIQGKEGGIPVLACLAPSSQTVGSNKRVIHEQVMNGRSEQHSHPKLGECRNVSLGATPEENRLKSRSSLSIIRRMRSFVLCGHVSF